MCTCVRGIKHDSIMKTAKLSGEFMNYKSHARKEFYNFVEGLK
jgi:GTP cyclohydrolase I